MYCIHISASIFFLLIDSILYSVHLSFKFRHSVTFLTFENRKHPVSVKSGGGGHPVSVRGGRGHPVSVRGGRGDPVSVRGGRGHPVSVRGGRGDPVSVKGGRGHPVSVRGGRRGNYLKEPIQSWNS